jgi:hypothetical protein
MIWEEKEERRTTVSDRFGVLRRRRGNGEGCRLCWGRERRQRKRENSCFWKRGRRRVGSVKKRVPEPFLAARKEFFIAHKEFLAARKDP